MAQTRSSLVRRLFNMSKKIERITCLRSYAYVDHPSPLNGQQNRLVAENCVYLDINLNLL